MLCRRIRIRVCIWCNLHFLSRQTTVRLYPFQIHSIALSSFASIVGPFGGFFASGFKRAFKIKVRTKDALTYTVKSTV